jgi:hypothetical protein
MPLHLHTEDGMIEAMTRDISSNGILFEAAVLPEIGSQVQFSMDMPAQVMGSPTGVSIHCTGRIVRHQTNGHESMAAAVIDQYFLKA